MKTNLFFKTNTTFISIILFLFLHINLYAQVKIRDEYVSTEYSVENKDIIQYKDTASILDILVAIERACDPNRDGSFDDKLDVISLSLGFGAGNSQDAFCKAINHASDIGVICCVTAGNEGSSGLNSLLSPGLAHSAITVDVSDKNDNWASFGSQGYLDNLKSLNPGILAPIVLIKSTLPNGEYDWVPEGNGNHVSGYVELTFNSNQEGPYVVWGNVSAVDGGDDSFWVSMYGGSSIKWNNIPHSSGWLWDDVHNTDDGGKTQWYNLNPDEHNIRFSNREDGTKLDRILITNDAEYVPNGGKASENMMVGLTFKHLMRLYPNSVKNELTIELNYTMDMATIEIINPSGILLYRTDMEIKTPVVLDVNFLEAGYYQLIVKDENGIVLNAASFVK